MYTLPIRQNEAHRITKLSHLFIIAFLLSITSTTISAADFQQNMLFSPSEHILKAEENGRVMIYDQLKSETVDRAMSEQFGRVENMMFVRTLYKQDDGDVVADEDCDD